MLQGEIKNMSRALLLRSKNKKNSYHWLLFLIFHTQERLQEAKRFKEYTQQPCMNVPFYNWLEE